MQFTARSSAKQKELDAYLASDTNYKNSDSNSSNNGNDNNTSNIQ